MRKYVFVAKHSGASKKIEVVFKDPHNFEFIEKML